MWYNICVILLANDTVCLESSPKVFEEVDREMK